MSDMPPCPKSTRSRHELLFDHLVSAGEQRRRYGKAKCLRSRQIDDQFELGGLFDWDVSGLRPAQYLVDVIGAPPPKVHEVRAIGHQTTCRHEFPCPVHG